VPIDIANDERVDITMRLTRQAVITGTVVANGFAMASYVQALRYSRVGGERRLVPASTGGVSPSGGLTAWSTTAACTGSTACRPAIT
jgi:hypothetical protein